MSIRYKILLILLTLALSTHLTITAVYYFYTQNSIKAESIKNLESMANVQEQRLKTFINSNFEKLKLIESRTQLRRSLKVYNQSGDINSLKMMKKISADAINSTQSVEDIFILNMNGDMLISINEKYPYGSYKNHQLFSKMISQEAVHYYVDKNNQDSTKILFSAPLELNNEQLGIIVMQVNMNYLNEYLRDFTGLGMSGEVLMALEYDDENMLYFTPLRFKKVPILVKKDSNIVQPMRLALKNIETTLESATDYRNESVIAITRYLDSLGFGIVVKMDKAEVFKSSSEIKILMLKLIMCLIVIVLIASVILANIITNPIIDITKAAVIISHGDFEKRIDKLSQDEIGQLVDALNIMADKLIKTNKILEEKVTERTEELRNANKRLEIMSQTDSLTGIANRGKFDSHLEDVLRRCKRHKTQVSLLIIDIDHFKEVNDSYGHQTGDIYLKKVADVLTNVVGRVDDLTARYGGEEFAIILESTDNENAIIIAEEIRNRIIDLQLENINSKVSKHLTISIGEATVVSPEDIDADTLIRRSDKALYEAKRKGRNQVISKLL